MKSVKGYNIYDKYGKVLYDGDCVKLYWGGGHDSVGRYHSYQYHVLYISIRGKLMISGCANFVVASSLVKQNNHAAPSLMNTMLKEYY